MKNENIEGEIFGYKVPLGVETTLSFMPLVGTAMDAYNLYKEPSWENVMNLGISAAAEIPFLKWLKAGKVLKVAKNTEKINKALSKYNEVNALVKKLESTPNIKPKRIASAKGRRGTAYLEHKKMLHSKDVIKDENNLKRYNTLEKLLDPTLLFTDFISNTAQQSIKYRNKNTDLK